MAKKGNRKKKKMDSEIESVLVPRCWPGRKWGRGATEEAARVLGGNGGKIRTMCYREMRRVSEIFFFLHPSIWKQQRNCET